MKKPAALLGELAAWEAEAEQPGSEEIARVPHALKADMFSFCMGLVPH